jgi:hypothetical protein
LNIAEHVCHLLERHKSKVLQRQQAKSSLVITSMRYKSNHANEGDQLHHSIAKRSLSSHSYKMFVDSLHHSQKLKHRGETTEGSLKHRGETTEGSFVVWSTKISEQEAEGSDLHLFPRTERCSCKKEAGSSIQSMAKVLSV